MGIAASYGSKSIRLRGFNSVAEATTLFNGYCNRGDISWQIMQLPTPNLAAAVRKEVRATCESAASGVLMSEPGQRGLCRLKEPDVLRSPREAIDIVI